jgi:MerR family transcriptional regulator, light-induced transcriptional regulator
MPLFSAKFGVVRPGEELVSLQEAADRLGVHYMTAYRHVRLGRLEAVKSGGQWQVPVRALTAAADVEERGTRGRPRVAVHRERLLGRLLADDERGAWSVVESALVAGLEPAEVHLALLGPAMRAVGDRWEAGELSVAGEHRATAIATRLVGRMSPHFSRPGRRRGTVVTGAVAGDTHVLPASLLSDVLRADQLAVVELGGDTPIESFVEAARSVDDLVGICLSFSVSGRDEVVRDTVAALRGLGPVLVGGPACEGPEHAASLGATATASDAAGVASLLGVAR